ncbi:MAG: peptidoglycan DD-metalloendopeptidase family protein [Cryomorphaceae bacterium]|jgi:murein DD-endopeptidase MepM/ murein hydrolase activator NlpD|nr:peptidoglycan DD-metalloendopeptidase family protein [Cryomorphaceae bacterium]
MQHFINRIFLFFSLLISAVTLAQPSVDTLDTPKGKLILHEDQTWSIATDPSFNGILNPRIDGIVNSYTVPFKQAWRNDVVYTGKGNDLTGMTDTIWLCLNEAAIDGAMDFCFPMRKIKVNSRYGPRSGRYHNGIDLALAVGDTIFAMFSGKVRYAKYNDGGFGNLVILRHYNGLETFYAHLSKFLVAPNQEVKVGDPIALGGNTGRSTGPHLHMEVRFYDAAINPEEIIDFDHQLLRKENLFLHRALFRPGAKPSGEFEVLSADQYALQNTGTSTTAIDQVAIVSAPVVKPVIKASQKKYYQIKSGDTLTRIAAKYGTTVSALCKLNGLSPSSTLTIGKNLRVK